MAARRCCRGGSYERVVPLPHSATRSLRRCAATAARHAAPARRRERLQALPVRRHRGGVLLSAAVGAARARRRGSRSEEGCAPPQQRAPRLALTRRCVETRRPFCTKAGRGRAAAAAGAAAARSGAHPGGQGAQARQNTGRGVQPGALATATHRLLLRAPAPALSPRPAQPACSSTTTSC